MSKSTIAFLNWEIEFENQEVDRITNQKLIRSHSAYINNADARVCKSECLDRLFSSIVIYVNG